MIALVAIIGGLLMLTLYLRHRLAASSAENFALKKKNASLKRQLRAPHG